MSTAMFTRAQRFGTYRTIVLFTQESSIEKMAALVFPSTNLATDVSRLCFLYLSAKSFTWNEVLVALELFFNKFHLKKIEISSLRSIIFRADTRRLLHCYLSATMFTKTLRFLSYRTIVLVPKQLSFEKIAALVFH